MSNVTLKNKKTLVIREPVVDDAESMIAYLSVIGGESDNLLFGKGEFPLTLEQEQEYIRNALCDNKTHMAVGFIGDKLVSMANIRSLGRPRNSHNAEMGLSVKKECWGIGVGNAMMADLIGFAREAGFKNVHLGVRAGNDAAIHLYEKFGFQKIGTHIDYFCVDGVYHDEILMDLYL